MLTPRARRHICQQSSRVFTRYRVQSHASLRRVWTKVRAGLVSVCHLLLLGSPIQSSGDPVVPGVEIALRDAYNQIVASDSTTGLRAALCLHLNFRVSV